MFLHFGSASTHWKSWNRGVDLTFLDCTGATVTYYIKAVNSVGESLVPRTTKAQLQSSPVCCSAWRYKSSILTRWNELIDMFIHFHHQLINLIMTYLSHFYHEFNDQHDQPDSTGLHLWGTAASASVLVAWGRDGGSQSTSEGTTRSYFENDPRCSKGLNVLTLAFDAGRASWSCQVVGLGIALELFNQQVNLVASSHHVIQLGEKTCKHMHQFSWGTFTTAPFVAIFRTLKG